MKNNTERRKGLDWFDVTVNLLNVVSWLVFLIALIIFHYARPEVDYFVYQMVEEQVTVRTNWIDDLKQWLQITLYFCLTFSVMTLVLNNLRLRRKTDRQRYGMYMLTILSVVFVSVVSLS